MHCDCRTSRCGENDARAQNTGVRAFQTTVITSRFWVLKYFLRLLGDALVIPLESFVKVDQVIDGNFDDVSLVEFSLVNVLCPSLIGLSIYSPLTTTRIHSLASRRGKQRKFLSLPSIPLSAESALGSFLFLSHSRKSSCLRYLP
jgi:hypothetical protein